MSDSNTPVSSAPGADSSATVSPDTSVQTQSGQITDTTEQVSTPKVVSFKVAEQYKADMFKFKERVRELETKLGDQESQRLKEKEDYKALYEREAEARAAAVKKAEDLAGFVQQDKKFNEVKAKAIQAGFRSEAIKDLELFNLDSVSVEATTEGRFIVHGADEYVQNLKQTRPYLFTDNQAPNVNGGRGGASQPTAKKISPYDVLAVEQKWKRREITKEEYSDYLAKYDKQQTQQT